MLIIHAKNKFLSIKKILLLLLIFMLASLYNDHASALEIMLNGQASAWTGFGAEWQAGIRYIPELRISHPLSGARNIGAEVSFNSFTQGPVNDLKDFADNADLKFYRSWVRYSTSQFEMRIGLQKINFGPAKILRSLMWFDRLDVRDPLKLTDGAYALLGRYYFLNNANIWVWGLYGNDNLKGLETFKTDKDRIEFGGRYQSPLPKGELAFSLNKRYVDTADWNSKMSVPMSEGLENRYALDGNWDVGVGLWFEASVGEIKISEEESLYQEFLTVGTDYTFNIGPGIHFLYEHFIKSTGSKIDKPDKTNSFSALLVDFRVSLLDNINAIGYYDWGKNKVYTYLGWQRTYDNWMVNLGLFSSSEEETGMYGGKGFLCMLIYNH